MSIPSIKPASEGGRLIALFNSGDGCPRVPSGWVGFKIVHSTAIGLLSLVLIGWVANPKENLREEEEEGFKRLTYKSRSFLTF